jgi:hypothetical protein
MLAIREGHNDIVKLLLGKGANVNLTTKWGDTALSFAVATDKEDNVEVVKLLLEKGAIGKLTDDEIKVVAENLKDFKTIYNNAEAFRIPELNDDLTSKILMYSLQPNGLGEELTLKIIDQIKILTAPATRSDPSLNSDGASARPLDPQQSSAQARATGHSAPFGESPPINPVVTADLVFVSRGVAQPYAQASNPHQPPPQASTINPSPHVAKSTQRGEPVVTEQLVPAPVPHEDPSNSPRGARPGSVRKAIAQIEERLKETKYNSR